MCHARLLYRESVSPKGSHYYLIRVTIKIISAQSFPTDAEMCGCRSFPLHIDSLHEGSVIIHAPCYVNCYRPLQSVSSFMGGIYFFLGNCMFETLSTLPNGKSPLIPLLKFTRSDLPLNRLPADQTLVSKSYKTGFTFDRPQ